jgi:hypothetical protein
MSLMYLRRYGLAFVPVGASACEGNRHVVLAAGVLVATMLT